MSFSPYLSIVIPAYNEVRGIAATLDSIVTYFDRTSLPYEILVCADGTDGTRELVAREYAGDRRVQVLGSPERGGKGRAVRLGVARSAGQIIGFMDADNKTPIEEIEHLLPWFDRDYDLVIGSRAKSGSQIEVAQSLHRRLGSKAFGMVMRTLTGLYHINDTQCGFKFFRRAVAKDLFARQRIDGYMFDVEVLYLAHQCGYQAKEVGVRWRDDGDSRLQLFAGNWRNMIDLFRIRFGAMNEAMANPERARAEKPVEATCSTSS
jgi:dolichyl-phosphate beta-glucosyltransferase